MQQLPKSDVIRILFDNRLTWRLKSVMSYELYTYLVIEISSFRIQCVGIVTYTAHNEMTDKR